MSSPFITVKQTLPHNSGHRIISLAWAHITAVTVPEHTDKMRKDGYAIQVYIVGNDKSMLVTGTEEEMIRLYENITGEQP